MGFGVLIFLKFMLWFGKQLMGTVVESRLQLGKAELG